MLSYAPASTSGINQALAKDLTQGEAKFLNQATILMQPVVQFLAAEKQAQSEATMNGMAKQFMDYITACDDALEELSKPSTNTVNSLVTRGTDLLKSIAKEVDAGTAIVASANLPSKEKIIDLYKSFVPENPAKFTVATKDDYLLRIDIANGLKDRMSKSILVIGQYEGEINISLQSLRQRNDAQEKQAKTSVQPGSKATL